MVFDFASERFLVGGLYVLYDFGECGVVEGKNDFGHLTGVKVR